MSTDSNVIRSIVNGITESALDHGVVNLIPYIGSGGVWSLATKIAENLPVTVNVAAPSPRLTRQVNDKLWFAEQVSDILGKRAVPVTRSVFGPAALTGEVRSLVKKYAEVVVKIPDSAGSVGNLRLDSSQVFSMSSSDLIIYITRMLAERGWHERYPIMVEVWDTPIVSSPSVQMWLPNSEEGGPLFEGLFDQSLATQSSSFVGAVKADLPDRIAQELVEEAMKLAWVFQRLGYFGRLSMDTVLTGEDFEHAEIHWIECNGRWGGVSIPMTLINRLVNNDLNVRWVVVQHPRRGQPSLPLRQSIGVLQDLLFQSGGNETGVILTSPHVATEDHVTQYVAVGSSLVSWGH